MCHSGNKNQLKFHYIRFFVQKVKSYIVDSIKAKLNEFKRVLKGCLKHPFYFYPQIMVISSRISGAFNIAQISEHTHNC